MLRLNLFLALPLVAFFAFASTSEVVDSSENRGLLQDNAISSVLPRYLTFLQAQPVVQNPPRPTKTEVVKPIIIVSGDKQGSSHHYPHYPHYPYPPYYPNPPYWPYYPTPPSSPGHHHGSPPATQPPNHHHHHHGSHPNDHNNNYPPYYHNHHQGGYYGGIGGGPAFIIINPSNLQALGGLPPKGTRKPNNPGSGSTQPSTPNSSPSNQQSSSNTNDEYFENDGEDFRSMDSMFANGVPITSAPTNSLSSKELNSLKNILQGIDSKDNLNDSTSDDSSEDSNSEVLAKYAPTELESGKAYTANLNPATLNLSPEEFTSLQQITRNLSPKQLLSLFSKDKGRQRKQVQEAIAGIYLRNFNLNKK